MTTAKLLCAAIIAASQSGEVPLSEPRVKLACSHAQDIVTEATNNKIDPFLVTALIWHESRWNPRKRGTSGECGVGQILPRFTDKNCRQLQNPTVAIQVLTKKLSVEHRKSWGYRAKKRCAWERKHKKRCRQNIRALAGYNGGTDGLRNSPTKRGKRGMRYARYLVRLSRRLRKY